MLYAVAHGVPCCFCCWGSLLDNAASATVIECHLLTFASKFENLYASILDDFRPLLVCIYIFPIPRQLFFFSGGSTLSRRFLLDLCVANYPYRRTNVFCFICLVRTQPIRTLNMHKRKDGRLKCLPKFNGSGILRVVLMQFVDLSIVTRWWRSSISNFSFTSPIKKLKLNIK